MPPRRAKTKESPEKPPQKTPKRQPSKRGKKAVEEVVEEPVESVEVVVDDGAISISPPPVTKTPKEPKKAKAPQIMKEDNTADLEAQAKTRFLEGLAEKDLSACPFVPQKSFQMINMNVAVYEEAILRHPGVLKAWLRYLDAKDSSSVPATGEAEESSRSSFELRSGLLQRAVAQFPGSYKLWKNLLGLRISHLLSPPSPKEDSPSKQDEKKKKPTTKLSAVERVMEILSWKVTVPLTNIEWERTNSSFEQALTLCHKFPILWLTYLVFLIHQPHKVTLTRRTFDRSLQALPVTQHPMIWKLYLMFAEQTGGETCVRIWKRYLTLNPKAQEDFIPVLLDLETPRYAQAARILAQLVAKPGYTSTSGKSTFQLWTELCDLVTEHPDDMDDLGDQDSYTLDVDAILRSGISKFSDQVGKIWNSLARWWILQGEWEKARDVYEEALAKVSTVRDFSMVFDTYAKMEEDVLSVQMGQLDANGTSETLDDTDIDMGLARFERLMQRRPFLFNDVLLRQNPHSVDEWSNRVRLWKDMENMDKIVETFTTALKIVSPKKADGSLPGLWTDFASFYLDNGDLDKARQVYENAVKFSFSTADDLVSVWCSYAEMEVNASEPDLALAILNRAVAPPKGSFAFLSGIRYTDDTREPHLRLFKSLKLWSFLVDLEESVGTVESTKVVYDRIIELKIATPQVIVNYATFLEENDYFEEVSLLLYCFSLQKYVLKRLCRASESTSAASSLLGTLLPLTFGTSTSTSSWHDTRAPNSSGPEISLSSPSTKSPPSLRNPFFSGTPKWKRTLDSLVGQWTFTTDPLTLLRLKTSLKSLRFTSPKPRVSLAWLQPETFTPKPFKLFQTRSVVSCVSPLLPWKSNLGKLIAPESFTLTALSSVTLLQTLSFGRLGPNLKSSLGMRTRSRKCSVSNVQFKPSLMPTFMSCQVTC